MTAEPGERRSATLAPDRPFPPIGPGSSAGERDRASWFHGKLLESVLHPVIAVDLRREVIYWNAAAEGMFGWTAAEAIGRNSRELISRAETPDETRAVVDAMRRGAAWSGDYEVSRRDGTRLPVRVTNRPVFDAHGHLVAVIAVCLDRSAPEAADLVRRELAAIVTGSGDAVFAVTTDGTVTSWNPAAEGLFGYSAAEIIGQSVQVIAPDRVEEQRQMRARLNAGGAPERLVTVRTRKDGSAVEVLLTGSIMTDEQGVVTGLSVIARDITEACAAQRALEASERRLAVAQQTAHLGDFQFDQATRQVTWSDELHRILGLGPGVEPSAGLFLSMVVPEDAELVRRGWSIGTTAGRPFDLDFRLLDTTRRVRNVRLCAVPELTREGALAKVIGTVMDDTERALADEVRRSAESRFEISFEQSGIGAAIVDLDGVPTRVNAALCAILGRPAESLTTEAWAGCFHPDDVPLQTVVAARVAAGHDDYEDERRFVRPDGSVVWVHTYIVVVRDQHGRPDYASAQFQDVTARKQMEGELERRSMHDTLTGLPNRALLTNRLQHQLAGIRRPDGHLAVISLNIDGLTAVNDVYGRPVGDELLKVVARQIVAACRPGDTVARCTGDEFVVACDDVTVLETEEIARRILTAVSEPSRCGPGATLDVTASLGVAIAGEGSTPEGLCRDSDVAMHRAKQRGRGRVELFDEVLEREAERRLDTATALRRGLERDELLLHYQPVIDLCTGHLVGVEALVRWERPGHGTVAPAGFIPLAEDTGLIVPIGAWVLDHVFQQLAEWHLTHPTLSAAVNLSVRQLASPDLVERIGEALARSGVAPGHICLELTESVVMDDVDHCGSILTRLKALGLRLSIDDFGTGYSSLSYLNRLPVDTIKVDQSFVDGLGTEPQSSALVAAIIAMGEALGLDVIAEGVETQAQLSELVELGCRRAQGYLLGRPMTAEALTRRLDPPAAGPVPARKGP